MFTQRLLFLISVYLSSLPVTHLSDGPRRRLVVTGNSARIQDETTESSAWVFNMLSVKHRHTGPRFNVSSEKQLVTVRLTSPGIEPTTASFQVERSVQLSYAGWSLKDVNRCQLNCMTPLYGGLCLK